jgi:hypothetical protein
LVRAKEDELKRAGVGETQSRAAKEIQTANDARDRAEQRAAAARDALEDALVASRDTEATRAARDAEAAAARRKELERLRDELKAANHAADRARSEARSPHTCPRTTASAWCTPILKDFARRISPPTPRFQSRHISTPFNFK